MLKQVVGRKQGSLNQLDFEITFYHQRLEALEVEIVENITLVTETFHDELENNYCFSSCSEIQEEIQNIENDVTSMKEMPIGNYNIININYMINSTKLF